MKDSSSKKQILEDLNSKFENKIQDLQEEIRHLPNKEFHWNIILKKSEVPAKQQFDSKKLTHKRRIFWLSAIPTFAISMFFLLNSWLGPGTTRVYLQRGSSEKIDLSQRTQVSDLLEGKILDAVVLKSKAIEGLTASLRSNLLEIKFDSGILEIQFTRSRLPNEFSQLRLSVVSAATQFQVVGTNFLILSNGKKANLAVRAGIVQINSPGLEKNILAQKNEIWNSGSKNAEAVSPQFVESVFQSQFAARKSVDLNLSFSDLLKQENTVARQTNLKINILKLKDGSSIRGTIQFQDANKIIIQSDGEELEVSRKDIVSIE